jgi:hypothetical protein
MSQVLQCKKCPAPRARSHDKSRLTTLCKEHLHQQRISQQRTRTRKKDIKVLETEMTLLTKQFEEAKIELKQACDCLEVKDVTQLHTIVKSLTETNVHLNKQITTLTDANSALVADNHRLQFVAGRVWNQSTTYRILNRLMQDKNILRTPPPKPPKYDRLPLTSHKETTSTKIN